MMKSSQKTLYPLLKLTFPLAITGLIQSAVWFFETIFLARLGPDTLAAGSLVSWLFGTVLVILFGTLSAINILVAHKHGAKNKEGILHVIRDGFWLAILFAAPTFLLFWYMSPLFLLVGQSPAVVALAQTYLHAVAWGVLPNVIIIAFLELLMGLGHARIILIYNILSVAFSIFFSFTLIFGKFGLPALGIAGAGWGLALSNWLSLVFIGLVITFNKEYREYFGLILTPSRPFYLIELLKIGTPMGLMYCVEVAFFLALTLIMGSFDSLILAANQIALQYLGILMAVIFSTAQAITIRMGHLLGAGDKKSAEQTAYIGIIIAGVWMSLVAVCYWCFPNYLIAIDFDIHDPKNLEIVTYARQFLIICAFFQVVEAVRISLFGTLRALKDTHFTLIISLISFWGLALPLGYFLAKPLNFGGAGLWWGMVFSAFCSVLLLLWRFKVKMRNFAV